MFRDKDEALKRLEALLLEEEEEETEELPQEEEATQEAFAEEDTSMPEDSPEFYRNFANDYTVYNSDRTEVSPEELSRELEKPERDYISIFLALLAATELLAIIAVLALMFI